MLICVLGMVGGDRNLLVRIGGSSQKRLGNTDLHKPYSIHVATNHADFM